MLYAAVPLYEVGGLRGILLLPMLGAVLAALAARALARRLGGDGMLAFWAIGLATPVAVYALDFWEHSLGLAAMLWGVVLLVDVARRRRRVEGHLRGRGAVRPRRDDAHRGARVRGGDRTGCHGRSRPQSPARHPGHRGRRGSGARDTARARPAPGAARVGQALRSGRASSAAAAGGTDLVVRIENVLRTTVGLNNYAPRVDWLFGALIVVLVGFAAAVLLDLKRHRARCLRGPRCSPVPCCCSGCPTA